MERNQSMFRVQKDKDNPYVMLNKGFLNDEKLSLKAKGLLAYFLSLPDDWQIYEDEIVNHHKDGKDSLKSAIKELIKNGYIERTRIRNENGQLKAYEYRVYEVSNQSGKPNVGETNIGESATTNNNLTNNKKTKKEILHHLDELNDEYVFSYLKIMKEYGLKHKRVTTDNLDFIRDSIATLKEDVDFDMWEETVIEYFDCLPKDNDGDILCFLAESRRHFEIEL